MVGKLFLPFLTQQDDNVLAAWASARMETVCVRDAIFRKITNRNQNDTNEIATTETKYQNDFYSCEKYQYLTKFYEDRAQDTDKIQRKYQEISDRNTKYRFGIGIFLVYQIFGYRLT